MAFDGREWATLSSMALARVGAWARVVGLAGGDSSWNDSTHNSTRILILVVAVLPARGSLGSSKGGVIYLGKITK